VPDLLLELLSEEIPARMQAAAAAQLQERFAAMLGAAGLTVDRVEAHVTPRRLALLAHGLPAASKPISEERRGPRADAPEQAIAGFLKSTDLARDALEERETGKGRFLFATIERPGRPTAEVLSQHLPAVIEGLAWPKSMRWGEASASSASPRWVRPLRGILALLDDALVPFEALGVRSGRASVGHRFLSAGPVDVRALATYAAQLREGNVILSAEERGAIIRERAAKAAAEAGLVLVADEALVAENAGLTEWPMPLLGRFDPAFLEVPPEIIALTMKANQKYFACRTKDGSLAPAFVCVANIEAPDGGATIVSGNERVLAARLSDARFFWEQDRKVPLEEQAKKLAGITFHAKLGSIADKVERVAKLARWLVETHPGQFPGASPDLVERAARLAKADLVTGTVGEFPELQGIIGGHLAAAQGEPPEVAAAIRDQYRPAGPSDDVPTAPVSVALGLAERLADLGGFFSVGEAPTGSRDPFALRRAALALIRLVTVNGVRLKAAPVAFHELEVRADTLEGVAAPLRQLRTFIGERLKAQAREAGVPHDLIDAVFALGVEDDLVRLLARVRALAAMIDTADGQALLAGVKRAANILRIEEGKDGTSFPPEPDPALLAEPAERALDTALVQVQDAVAPAVDAEDFQSAMRAIASLRPLVDRFFDEVTVNASDPALRANRLKLLARLRATAHLVADFSKVEG
jgi:glycyl-tRNA synthetase beta chain